MLYLKPFNILLRRILLEGKYKRAYIHVARYVQFVKITGPCTQFPNRTRYTLSNWDRTIYIETTETISDRWEPNSIWWYTSHNCYMLKGGQQVNSIVFELICTVRLFFAHVRVDETCLLLEDINNDNIQKQSRANAYEYCRMHCE